MSRKFENTQYRQICSEKTLQSNSQGFFLDFANFVAQKAGDKWIRDCFGKLRSDSDRIRYVYQSNETKDFVQNFLSNVQEVYRPKDAEFSQKKRLEADKLMAQDNFRKALMLYCQSVLRAPTTKKNLKIDSGLTLSLALWGRAQALIKLRNYSKALLDIKQALKEHLPEANKSKAFWLMGVCNEILGEQNKADVAYSLTKKMTDSSDVEKLQEERYQLVVTSNKSHTNAIIKRETGLDCPSKDLPNASRKLRIRTSPNLGRYVVAKNSISAGETLVMEPPYAACLLPEMFGSNCHHCFLSLEAPYACPDCSSVAFCSLDCRDEAVSSYHKYECKYLDLLIGSGMSILAHTALRMITQDGLAKCLEAYTNRDKEKVFQLCTNAHLRSPEDFLQRTLMAAFLLKCLQKSGFFNESVSSSVTPSEEEHQIGEMLLFNLQMLQFNAHEIYETRHSKEHRIRGSKIIYIGVAVYLTASFFNHDCFPALSRYFVGKNIILTSTRPLKPNDIVPENYGPIFTRKTLMERQRSLSSRYWFDCHCTACKQDWPSIGKGVSTRLRCTSDNCDQGFTLPINKELIKCPKCKVQVDLSQSKLLLKWCEEQFQAAFELMDQKEIKKAINVLRFAIDAFYKVSLPPHRQSQLAEEMLSLCLADSGNTREINIC